jgi:hypothetical protein
MLKQIFLVPVFTLALLSTGCSKDDDTPQQTRTELITQGSWKFESASAMGQDVSGALDDCLVDNIYTLASNGTGSIDESTLICDPSAAGNFTWEFQANESKLNVSTALFPGGSGLFDIVSINQTNLVVSQEMTISPFPTTTVQITLKH